MNNPVRRQQEAAPAAVNGGRDSFDSMGSGSLQVMRLLAEAQLAELDRVIEEEELMRRSADVVSVAGSYFSDNISLTSSSSSRSVAPPFEHQPEAAMEDEEEEEEEEEFVEVMDEFEVELLEE